MKFQPKPVEGSIGGRSLSRACKCDSSSDAPDLPQLSRTVFVQVVTVCGLLI
jgi:hypothetical protein